MNTVTAMADMITDHYLHATPAQRAAGRTWYADAQSTVRCMADTTGQPGPFSALEAAMSNPLSFSANVGAACLALGFARRTFTSAEVRSFLEGQGIRPNHCNAWGASFAAAQSQGLISRVETTTSTRASRNHGRVIVWTLTGPAWCTVLGMALAGGPQQSDYVLTN